MRRLLLALGMVAAILVPGSAHSAATCAPDTAPGGEWSSYGRDLNGRRDQPAETTITGDNLVPAFAASIGSSGELGGMLSTAVVSGTCIYAGTTLGSVVAFSADTGELVWRTSLAGDDLVAASLYAVTVADGDVFAIFGGASAISLDAATGAVNWRTDNLPSNGGSVNASAIVFDGLLFVPTTGPDGDSGAHPPFHILEASTGQLLKTTFPIPDSDFEQGYSGGGIWTTAVVDQDTKHLFAGTANPDSKRLEHDATNSIIKIDMDRTRPTFGQVVDIYKGTHDQYVDGLDDQAACQTLGDLQTSGYSVFCFQLDIDFGASPNLWKDSTGRTIVGELQKSGIYHAVYADTMEPKWTAVVSAPTAPGNIATSAVDETSVYTAVTPGLLHALDRETGAIRWTAPLPPYHYAVPVSTANGVVYTLGPTSTLHAYDAETGAILGVYALGADAGDNCTTLGGGVSIARNKLYAVCDTGGAGGGWIVAYEAA